MKRILLLAAAVAALGSSASAHEPPGPWPGHPSASDE